MTSALDEGGWSTTRPGRFYPRETRGTHRTGGWVGPGPVWIGAENLPPPGFDPRIFQPVASRCNDCAIPAPSFTLKASLYQALGTALNCT
jgi:hypothetical protein